METINFEDFTKIDLRVAMIREATRVDGSSKIIKLVIDLGSEKRQVLAGVGEYYSPEELIDKKIVVVVNLLPRKIMGFDSEAMVLAVKDSKDLSLLNIDKEIELGSRVS
ncbi:MAG: methionine--tRNA ligase subunit beta [Candidatus Pacebacteria bacterium]|nr:methionine--tRNA ligase subunit beta [Candidatus Paceibacterota bacterium]